MSFRYIEIEHRNHVAIIWLNRPERRNALNCQFVRELSAAVTEINGNPETRVIVLMGRGRLFCAGADLTDVYDPDIENAEQLIENLYKPLLSQILASEKLFISAVTGTAVGAGASLALVCDLTLMSSNANLSFAFTTMALVPDCGASWLLVRQLGYKRALQVIAEGQQLTALQCQQVGLCNEIVEPESLEQATLAMAERLAERAPLAISLSKQLLQQACEQPYNEMVSAEAKAQYRCEQSSDFAEAKSAFFEKRPPVFGK
ncbi:enoyl-CoA hydratase/isomerase family protein [Halioxenophilus sp. WMMB6]|uniref:enoyl-CoA hydratase/isomerase family protein n=1 Tax=Halioxenophilus sp. WMMB6 TaxID=3073815 RepID=UPI00295E776B|nr:enoyl-CoA hydratase/isomerase family protein [Halioxenophilus sp. WMMB6]